MQINLAAIAVEGTSVSDTVAISQQSKSKAGC
jgi:hypothetical protein